MNFALAHSSCGKISRLVRSEAPAETAFEAVFCLPVPELTRSVGINLNERLSLRRRAKAPSVSAPDIVPIIRTHPWRSRRAITFRSVALFPRKVAEHADA
jgi:hypothetical protein